MSQTTASGTRWTLEAAYRYCQRLAETHYENFTVGSLLMPKALRRHLYAIYGYCRSADDLGDEANQAVVSHLEIAGLVDQRTDGPTYRLALLDWWQSELEACYQGTPNHPVMVALQHTIQRFDIPLTPFLKLIEANRIDQRQRGYATYNDLLYYCDHSANPVGHLFLYLFGYRDQDRQRRSDATCTALQLTNFWQDVSRDYQKGRVYLPQEDMSRFGYTEDDLSEGAENDAFRGLMAFQVERTIALFSDGATLVDTLQGPAKLDVALFTRGGVAVLEAIRRQNYRVLTSRPALSHTRKAWLFLSTWFSWKLGQGPRLPGASRGDLPS